MMTPDGDVAPNRAELFRLLVEGIEDCAIFLLGKDGTVVSWNVGAERINGYSREEILGQHFSRFYPSEETLAGKPDKTLARASCEGAYLEKCWLVRKDGSHFLASVITSALCDAKGRIVGYAQRVSELAVRHEPDSLPSQLAVSRQRREEWQRSFLAQATIELNSSLDYQTTLTTIARAAVPQLADLCAVDVLEGDRLQRLAVTHIDEKKVPWVKELERRYPADLNAPTGVPNILRTGQPEILEDISDSALGAEARNLEHLHLIRQLGVRSYMGVPMRARGKTLGVISFIMADSNRRYDREDLALAMLLADRAAVAIDNARLFGEMKQARAEAEVANRAKDEFLAILGHELRNPLAPILIALQMMKLRADDTFDRERTVIERQVKHLVRLVDDLLDISRITTGKVELRKELVHISEVVAKAIEMASPLLEERQHDVSVSVDEELRVEGDEVRLAQVVANLLNNAAKYTEKGGRIAICAERQNGDVVVRVSDTGIGIAKEMLPRIFDLFVQEPQALDRSRGGLGLGLSIVRSLVTLHGGSVSAHSDGVGKGTEVVVRLPALDLKKASTVSLPRSRTSIPVRNPCATRILIVDDNADAAQLLSEALETLGHETHVAYDGPSGLVLAEKVRPALAMLDIGLPVMDGYELARRIRSLNGLDGIRLVAITGYGQRSDRLLSLQAGFDEHLVKPIEIHAVQSVLNKLIETSTY